VLNDVSSSTLFPGTIPVFKAGSENPGFNIKGRNSVVTRLAIAATFADTVECSLHLPHASSYPYPPQANWPPPGRYHCGVKCPNVTFGMPQRSVPQ